MIKLFGFLLGALLVAGGGWYFIRSNMPLPAPAPLQANLEPQAGQIAQTEATARPSVQTQPQSTTTAVAASDATPALAAGQVAYTDDELLAMADNKYALGDVPLGDYKYVTGSPKKGYVYLCNVHKDNPGSMVNGPWMGTNSWNFLQKISISGQVTWPDATFTEALTSALRTLSGNDLPINGITTGTFSVQKGDEAYQYDPNPNTISAQSLEESLPRNPTYSATPYCMGGEVGIMQDGVALFDAFDAGLRDAPAHELQDSCDGHPQGTGEYHYHSLSDCFSDIGEKTVLGFAYDGFPITGPLVAPSKYLTTDDLDECHGLTSEINLDGKKVVTYHYVMTQDFPYSASCFRGKPVTTGPSSGTQGVQQQGIPPPRRLN